MDQYDRIVNLWIGDMQENLFPCNIKIMVNKLSGEFTSNEPGTFKFKMGRVIVSSLSGFIAGVVFASIIWVLAIYLSNLQ